MSKIYIIGTPIGNLKDITLRALETLKICDAIACEDTRVSGKLLSYYGIDKKLISYSKINEKKTAEYLIEMCLSEEINLGLVSDAGMPMVSDPGFELISLARKNDISIELIPGVNAAISAFALSGLSSTFVFHGFPKEKKGQRQNQLESLSSDFSHIFYVSPHKLNNFLDDLEIIWADKIQIFIARELTKIHETQYFGNIRDIRTQLDNTSQKGEFTIVIKPVESKKIKINKYAEFSKVKN
ncbi:16S rRNA (cytidine(1402)-2'-O)-methyltransferase [Mycoplasma zalophidermidis]|uniref:16S rRNA (cytidine(1402)-2'-O)-methyltransferase n=1 Tax=Mycoplasma zalophidermidis TaxID=398174 RepID=UPI001C1149F0|nr:16S rRNA (cytidine(1402)-2'-O)-methyltransferase [Mycoplasma zalophidermidis]MBU4689485.1 16S rRNA (cytidine(1402)-2'-O)-methyltransferase [Mycoplasma zalophidermidis]MCR8966339.1 16S rRNA (cytidine(1402)-2'-O)-methyltransferase [Mycoplasma zalophidermidis]